MTETTAVHARHVIGRIARGLMGRGGEGVENVIYRMGEQDLKNSAFRLPVPASKPVVRYLAQTIEITRTLDTELADAIATLAPALCWKQNSSYTDAVLGEGFADNYAWCQLIGDDGFFAGQDYRVGFLLLGPERHYLDHYHPAPELYWPLTAGSWWKKGNGEFVERQQGEVIWHPSLMTHATMTKDQPLLATYIWTRHTSVGARLCAFDQAKPGGAAKA